MLTAEQRADHLRSTLTSAIGEVKNYINLVGSQVNHDSPAANEAMRSSQSEIIMSIASLANLLHSSIIDHLELALLARDVTHSPFTVIRGAVEASAVLAWLTEKLPIEARLARSFGYRFASVNYESQYIADEMAVRGLPMADYLPAFEKLASKAASCGVSVLRNKKGLITQIGEKLPGFGDLTAQLGVRGDWRLLSGMGHSFPWAVRPLGYRTTGTTSINEATSTRVVLMEKRMLPEAFSLQVKVAWDAFAIASSRFCWYCGKRTDMHAELIREVYRRMGARIGAKVQQELDASLIPHLS